MQDIDSCAKFVEVAATTVAAFETKYKTKISTVNTLLSTETGTEITGGAGMAAVWETFHNQVK